MEAIAIIFAVIFLALVILFFVWVFWPTPSLPLMPYPYPAWDD